MLSYNHLIILEECLDKEEKCRLGVYWLLKASEKGHLEGTTMLQECLDNGIGTFYNIVCLIRSYLMIQSRSYPSHIFLSLIF